MANIPHKLTADRLLYARSLAHDLASLKQTFAAGLIRDLVGEIEALRKEVAELKTPRPTKSAEVATIVDGALSVSQVTKHGGESDGHSRS